MDNVACYKEKVSINRLNGSDTCSARLELASIYSLFPEYVSEVVPFSDPHYSWEMDAIWYMWLTLNMDNVISFIMIID